MSKRLRSGFTTGACSSAAAKCAVTALIRGEQQGEVEISFPDGKTHTFPIHSCLFVKDGSSASVIKDAGDDPDVTNGAEIKATVYRGHRYTGESPLDCITIDNVKLCRGTGVGRVTKAGLAVGIGEPAINPVPRKMITSAVKEVTSEPVTVIISIADGLELADKTLNRRLGILDGLSILGTTGIVRPVSAQAWKATIEASLDVAREAGLKEVVLSTGRTSESGAQQQLALKEEAYAMMGDYLEFSLLKSAERGFDTIHLAGMWAKIMKAALKIPQTHVRNGALEVEQGARLLSSMGADGKLKEKLFISNTAREMLTHIDSFGRDDLVRNVCLKAKEYGEEVSGKRVKVYLINHKARIICHV